MARNTSIIATSMAPGLKKAIKGSLKLPRLLTGQIRIMPDFIIIGPARCGTTSLYHYLIKHPGIFPSFSKEVHFFDLNFDRGIAWYRAHFPTFLYRYYVEEIRKEDFMTGEASPYYICYPHAPKRIFGIIPQVKLITLLRNPVDRAYSHYYRNVRRGLETLSFEDATEKEEERTRGEMEKMIQDESYHSVNHRRYSYLSMGIYVDQLKTWLSFFPKRQLLVLKSEDFFLDPVKGLTRVIEFLNLPSWELKDYRQYEVGHYPNEMSPTTRRRLIEYFEPHNRRLYDFLGVNFGWEK
jgi:hypothetical protein